MSIIPGGQGEKGARTIRVSPYIRGCFGGKPPGGPVAACQEVTAS